VIFRIFQFHFDTSFEPTGCFGGEFQQADEEHNQLADTQSGNC